MLSHSQQGLFQICPTHPPGTLSFSTFPLGFLTSISNSTCLKLTHDFFFQLLSLFHPKFPHFCLLKSLKSFHSTPLSYPIPDLYNLSPMLYHITFYLSLPTALLQSFSTVARGVFSKHKSKVTALIKKQNKQISNNNNKTSLMALH